MGNSELLGTKQAEEQAPDNQKNRSPSLFIIAIILSLVPILKLVTPAEVTQC